MRLYKNDNIKLTHLKTKEVLIYRVAGYSTSANKLDIRPNLETNSKENQKSINTIFKENHVNKLRG